jgi:hypothetical protein
MINNKVSYLNIDNLLAYYELNPKEIKES